MEHEHKVRTSSDDARDAIGIGLLFVAFGIVSWLASGGRFRDLVPRRAVPDAFHRAFDGVTDALAWGSPDDRTGAARRVGTDG